LDRHREQKEAEQIVKQARDFGLPPDARAKPWHRELSEWQVKLLRTIKDRLSDEDDYPLDTTRSTVKEAVAEITREFEAHQEAERDLELRERVKASAPYSIPFGLNDEGRHLAIQAIAEGIDRACRRERRRTNWKSPPMRHCGVSGTRFGSMRRRQQEEARLQVEEGRRKRMPKKAAARQRREADEEQARKRSAAERRADSFADMTARATSTTVASMRTGSWPNGQLTGRCAGWTRYFRPAVTHAQYRNPSGISNGPRSRRDPNVTTVMNDEPGKS
jgi:hypothetical protein